MHALRFKSAVVAGAIVMLASVSVPVGVSASVSTQQQQVQRQRVSKKKVRQFNQRVAKLSPAKVNHQLTTMPSHQLHKQATKVNTQLKQSLSDPAIAQQLKKVTLADMQSAATAANVAKGKKMWTTSATNKLQKQLKHTTTTGLTAEQAQALKQTSVSQAVDQVTPSQVKTVLKGLTSDQWQTLLEKALSTADTQIQSMKTPTNAQLKNQGKNLTSSEVNAVKTSMTTAAQQTTQKEYYTDAINNGQQLAVRSNLASSLIGLLLPAISIAVKLGMGPTAALIAKPVFQVMLLGILAVVGTIAEIIAPKIFSIFFPVFLAAIPIVGPAISLLSLPLNLGGSVFVAAVIPPMVTFMGLAGSEAFGLMTSVLFGTLATIASLFLPILPPVLTPPLVTVGQRFDQTITYADSLKNGHQYTQAINVQAGKSYKVSFKADQAVNPETNDPITNFGTLTYGLVGTPTEAIANSSVSDLVANVQNGSATINSRAKTNYVITFDAQKTGTLYLVADTAQATINTGIQHSQYSTTPLWYVNSAIDATLN